MYELLCKIADSGKVVCDTYEMRSLWYKGLVSLGIANRSSIDIYWPVDAV